MEIAALFRSLVLLLLSEKCYDTFFVEFDFLHAGCLKAAISKGLGVGIILGSTFVKIPQITKIIKARSAKGIALLGCILELVALSSATAYNYSNGYPFSSWGEYVFLLVETAIIAFLVIYYGGRKLLAVVFLVSTMATLYVLISGLTPLNILWSLQAANLPIVVVAKMLQAVTNFSQGHTGQLSAVTILLLLTGSIARVFTSIQETGDSIVVAVAACSSAANAVLAFQMLYYWKVTDAFLSKSVKSDKKKSSKASKAALDHKTDHKATPAKSGRPTNSPGAKKRY